MFCTTQCAVDSKYYTLYSALETQDTLILICSDTFTGSELEEPSNRAAVRERIPVTVTSRSSQRP